MKLERCLRTQRTLVHPLCHKPRKKNLGMVFTPLVFVYPPRISHRIDTGEFREKRRSAALPEVQAATPRSGRLRIDPDPGSISRMGPDF